MVTIKKKNIITTYLNLWRVFIGWICVNCSKYKDKIYMDFSAYKRNIMPAGAEKYSEIVKFGYCLFEEPSFRNVILNRLHRNPILYFVFCVFFKPVESLYISVAPEKIGGGIFFQHGFATIVLAESIGENCWINQQVTIGAKGMEIPILDDNVKVYAGAIVLGSCRVKSGATIGAGAVVTHDVAEGMTVVGVPARAINIK